MNLKKAKNLLGELRLPKSSYANELRWHLMKVLETLVEPDEELTATQYAILLLRLNCTEDKVKALAEPDEGEMRINCPHCNLDITNLLSPWCPSCGKQHHPPTPAFEFGDLVKDENGKPGIFQRYITEETCWVLTLDGAGDFIGKPWDVKDLKLIQRGCFNVTLKRIRDKLMKG